MTNDETPTPKTSGSFAFFLQASTELRQQLVKRALTYYANDGIKADRMLKLAERAELAAQAFASWAYAPPTTEERARDIDALMVLRELAREEGLSP